MDEKIVEQILELLRTMQAACTDLQRCAEEGRDELFERLCGDLEAGLTSISNCIGETDTGGNRKLGFACWSLLASCRNLRALYGADREACRKKVEFELLPLLQEATLSYYFFQYLADHPERLPAFYAEEKGRLCGNRYIDEAMRTGRYRYDLSIVVMAYNKLEYTRRCVESLRANLPAGLNYELILVNHGSTDGTKEYFASLHPEKQLDIAVNGGGMWAFSRIVEGEFTLWVSNDVLVTPHAIENLLACIRSDPQIAWVVPSTTNVSNYQTIPAGYNNEEEMLAFAESNNRQDPYRWEQRVRLCNPIDIRRSSVFSASSGLCLTGHYHTADLVHSESFPDDRYSLLLRRAGWKMMLAKDAYCHHFGSVTLKDEISQQDEQKYYRKGREEFFRTFGVDPWSVGASFDPIFLQRVVGNHTGHVEVLGVNCGFGASPLKIKEQLKEYCRNTDVRLSNVTCDPVVLPDLRGIGEAAAEARGADELRQALAGQAFDYIIWEQPFPPGEDQRAVFRLLRAALAEGGMLLIRQAGALQALGTAARGGTALGGGWWAYRSRARAQALAGLRNRLTLPARIQLLNGGLGNQAFQYIFARFAERRHPGVPWYFDDSEFFLMDYHNGYELDRVFGVRPRLLSRSVEPRVWDEILRQRKEGLSLPQILLEMGSPVTVVAETDDLAYRGEMLRPPANTFCPEVIDRPEKTVYYHGYWINRDWFGTYKEEMRAELAFPPLPDARNRGYAAQIRDSLSVGVHIRRGDFVQLGWLLPESYYKNACENVLAAHPEAHFFVFTDDTPWCRENEEALGLTLTPRTTYIEGNTNPNNYVDMQLLSLCQGMILSTSSFCYLAALLNPRLQFYSNPTRRQLF